MIAVDTNIIVRLLTRDDEKQFIRAYGIFQDNQVFIADTVLLETVWVLGYAYEFERDKIAGALTALCGQNNVHLPNPSLIAKVISWYEKGVDFADAFHLANSRSCSHLLTFDTKFIRRAKGLSTCVVSKPLVNPSTD